MHKEKWIEFDLQFKLHASLVSPSKHQKCLTHISLIRNWRQLYTDDTTEAIFIPMREERIAKAQL